MTTREPRRLVLSGPSGTSRPRDTVEIDGLEYEIKHHDELSMGDINEISRIFVEFQRLNQEARAHAARYFVATEELDEDAENDEEIRQKFLDLIEAHNGDEDSAEDRQTTERLERLYVRLLKRLLNIVFVEKPPDEALEKIPVDKIEDFAIFLARGWREERIVKGRANRRANR